MLYVLAIRNNQSGGSESLHQFAATVKKNGRKVAMYYPDSEEKTLPPKFANYGIDVAQKVDDIENNVMVVPETETKYLMGYKHIKKCIWWLSRDFYYGYANLEGLVRSAERHNISPFLYFIYIPVVFLKKKMTPGYFRFGRDKNSIYHMYNCEYARLYLEEKGVRPENTLYMCGPIRSEYFEAACENKEAIVTYNPKKNYRFTKLVLSAVRERRPDIQLTAIEKMQPADIVALLGKCKVYIDFGQFPGPERIPREAVTRRCNIITSQYGSTRNEIDVPIPCKYKIKADKKNIPRIVDQIIELIDHYEEHVDEYDDYRKKVLNQIELLEQNTKLFIEHFKI